MVKLSREMIKYWMESAILSGDMRLRMVSGSIGAMWTLNMTVDMLWMDGLLRPTAIVCRLCT